MPPLASVGHGSGKIAGQPAAAVGDDEIRIDERRQIVRHVHLRKIRIEMVGIGDVGDAQNVRNRPRVARSASTEPRRFACSRRKRSPERKQNGIAHDARTPFHASFEGTRGLTSNSRPPWNVS